MEHRNERVLVETSRYRISGTLTLPREGYRSRITDFLNAGDREFVALQDVSMRALDGSGEVIRHEFIALARRHVVLVTPLEGGAADW